MAARVPAEISSDAAATLFYSRSGLLVPTMATIQSGRLSTQAMVSCERVQRSATAISFNRETTTRLLRGMVLPEASRRGFALASDYVEHDLLNTFGETPTS